MFEAPLKNSESGQVVVIFEIDGIKCMPGAATSASEGSNSPFGW